MKGSGRFLRWLKFGGWMARVERGETNGRGAGIRFRPGRVFLDLVKLALLLVLLQLLTLPFRPLALEPPPDDLLARYLPPEAEPTGDGTADRMLRQFDELTYPLTNTTNDTATAWRERWERFCARLERHDLALYDDVRTDRWQRLVDDDVDTDLDALLTNVIAFANACANEAPRPKILRASILPGYLMPMRLLRLDVIRQVDRAAPEAAREAIGRSLDVSVFASRGWALNWMVSAVLVKRATRGTLRLAECEAGLPIDEALALDKVWESAGDRSFPFLAALRRESFGPAGRARATLLYRQDVRCAVYLAAIGMAGPLSRFGDVDLRYSFFDPDSYRLNTLYVLTTLGKHSALAGNDRRAVARVSERVAMWSAVRLGAMLDPLGPSLEDLDAMQSAAGTTSWWARGRVALPARHHLDRYAFKQSVLWSDCLAARTATMLAAYRADTGGDAKTLEDVAERFDWTVPEHPLTGQPMDYAYLTPPQEATPGAGGYALASWADGRAILPGGGHVWLVVRNPAFGALPFRVYTWSDDGEDGGAHTNAVRVTETEMTPLSRGERLPALDVPASLFRPGPSAWSRAERAMRHAGWRVD